MKGVIVNYKVKYDENPFLSNLLLDVGKKQVQISKLGRDNNILVNQITGEDHGGTHIVSYKKVEKEKFVKTFLSYIGSTFDLTRCGNKALRLLMWAMANQSINKDVVILDQVTYEKFIKAYKETVNSSNFSYRTFQKGLTELSKASVVAKTTRTGAYFINPQLMFNGDRIVFTTVIERDKELDKANKERQALEEAGQQRLEM